MIKQEIEALLENLDEYSGQGCDASGAARCIRDLQKGLDDMTAKAIAATWLIPEEILMGELLELRAHAKEVLAGKDKQTIVNLQDELANVREALRHASRPQIPGVNCVLGFKDGNRHVAYPLMLTSVRHAFNGGLEIEVQLP